MSGILRIKENVGDTTFKTKPQQVDKLLKSDPTYVAKAGELFFVSAIDRGSSDPKSPNYYGGNHWKVTFKKELQPREGGKPISTWFVYQDHVEEYRLIK
ncbi:MAG: hypothetical protein KME40_03205 [Komarekiella atlantica HA4396-MV6]|jgi:hypothetical protein|nr:hypothetical protein [Komarekiella atlantica HA4396-MV6]